jgi:hypothetical protein
MSCKRSLGIVALGAALMAGLCGCNNARMVRWDGASGVVAIPHNDNVWPEYNREHAEALIRERCPRGYTIVNEEEVVVGQVQHTHVNTDRTGDPALAALHIAPVTTRTNETMTTEDRKEWRITFQAAGAPPMTMPGPVIQTGAVMPMTPPGPVAPLNPPTPAGLPPAPVPVGR